MNLKLFLTVAFASFASGYAGAEEVLPQEAISFGGAISTEIGSFSRGDNTDLYYGLTARFASPLTGISDKLAIQFYGEAIRWPEYDNHRNEFFEFDLFYRDPNIGGLGFQFNDNGRYLMSGEYYVGDYILRGSLVSTDDIRGYSFGGDVILNSKLAGSLTYYENDNDRSRVRADAVMSLSDSVLLRSFVSKWDSEDDVSFGVSGNYYASDRFAVYAGANIDNADDRSQIFMGLTSFFGDKPIRDDVSELVKYGRWEPRW